jgi:hypothetical protein
MAKKKLFKSKTNFTIRRVHQNGNFGTIYERDYVTINNNGTSPEGQIPIYNSPSFKLSVRAGFNGQKKYQYGQWLPNPSSEGSNIWTIGCMPEGNKDSSKIILKPHSHKLTDFACYGSATQLIKVALTNVVANFPAELFVTDKGLKNSGLLETGSLGENSALQKHSNPSNFFLVDNPMLIDLVSNSIPENSLLSSLRYFCESAYDYDVINESGEIVASGAEYKKQNQPFWKVTTYNNGTCVKNGDCIAQITVGGNKATEKIEIYAYYYDGKKLYFTNGHKGYRIRPNESTVNKYHLGLSEFERVLVNHKTNYTAKFETYVETADEGWKLTEKTYKWPTGYGGWNLAINGVGYSRYASDLADLADAYDTLLTNSIWRTMTHEAIVNLDLTENLNEDEDFSNTKVKSALHVIGRQFDDIKMYADNIKHNNTLSYSQDGNMPDYFLSDKMSLSGWEPKDILNEISNDIISTPQYPTRQIGYTASEANSEFIRRLLLNSRHILAEKGTKRCIEDLMGVFGYHSVDWLKSYPGKFVNGKYNPDDLRHAFILIEYVYVANGYAYNKTATDVIENVKRLNQLKDTFSNEDINSDYGFDEYQGLPVVEVSVGANTRLVPWFDKEKKYDTNLYFQMAGGWARNDGNNQDDIPKYGYSISKIHYVETLNDLYDISYVNLDGNGLYYVNSESKYYKIKDSDKHQEEEGWAEATDEEIEERGNIIENNKGNNPHTGLYDDGFSYLEAFGSLFKDSTFNNVRATDAKQNYLYGFNMIRQADSTKCLYFSETPSNNSNTGLRGRNKIVPHNFFGGDSYDEAASLSVVNSKELHIIFDDAHRDFLEKDVIHYIKQIIPSTTIFSYSFEHLSEDMDKPFNVRTHQIICNGNVCPIYGVVE